MIRQPLYLTVDLGIKSACAIDIIGDLMCNRDMLEEKTTVPLLLTGGIIAVAQGEDFACALDLECETKCWGSNLFGQLDFPE